MEDFIGILLFVLYLIFSVTKSRKKGMQKNRSRKSPQPVKEVGDTRVKEQPRTLKRAAETAGTMQTADNNYRNGSGYRYPDEAKKNYGTSVSAKETSTEQVLQPILEAPADSYEENVFQPVISLDKASILQAVIWNEILQKPKGRRSHT